MIYATPDNLRTFRVPSTLQPLVKVSDRFHLKPLLRATTFCNAGCVLDNLYRERIERWYDRYGRRLNEDRATTDLVRSARAATAGAAASLVVDMDQVVNGTVEEADGTIKFAESAGADSYGGADEVARRALLTGGEVLTVRAEDMPEPGKPVAAILRYPI